MKTVAIAGAGITGLATALELAGRGISVTVYERGQAMREASWAAAGMLAAEDPENPTALREFARFSLSLYPAFLEALRRCAPVRLRTSHTLQVCEAGQGSKGIQIGERLSPEEAMRRVPGLRLGNGKHALWLKEHSLDPRELGAVLLLAVRAARVTIREGTPVLSVQRNGAGILVGTTADRTAYDALIVTAGAWSSDAVSEPSSVHLLPHRAIVPRKGQILRVREPQGSPLQTVLRTPEIYIVPRGDGSLVVGATVEDAGFDRTVREEATAWLLARAAELWAPLGDGPVTVEEEWTGLRPAAADALPVLGRGSDAAVLFATGHYRNGILLAPGTARVMAQLLLGETPSVDISALQPDRFAHPSANTSAVGVVLQGVS